MGNIDWADVKPLIKNLMHENRKIKAAALTELMKMDLRSLVHLLVDKYNFYRLLRLSGMKKYVLSAMIELDTNVSWEAVLHIYFIEGEHDLLPIILEPVLKQEDQSRVITILGDFIETDKYPDQAMFTLLGRFDDSRSIFGLCRKLLIDKSNFYLMHRKITIIRFLSRYKDDEPVNMLIHILQNDKSVEVRREAAKALYKIQSKISITALLEVLTKETDGIIRKTVMETLYFIPDKKMAPALCDLLMQGKNREMSDRFTALKILGIIKDHESLPVLYRLYTHEIDTELRISCLKVISEIKDDSVIPFIKELIRDEPTDSLRLTAGKIFIWLGWKAETEREQTYHDIALHKWDAVKAKGLSAIEPLLHIQDIDNSSGYHSINEEIDQAISDIYSAIVKAYFGETTKTDRTDSAFNPVVPDLQRPLKNLKTIIIDSPTFNRELLEKFITYLTNTLGESVLKEKITISIRGDRELIHKNLLNMFQNIFKHIERNH
ncbi:MAG: HEAT repeat domain-containing protein [Spirochaetales bacterium]|nr:HEAT repeat domain-containing protein [Spirochaetales bacterium]